MSSSSVTIAVITFATATAMWSNVRELLFDVCR